VYFPFPELSVQVSANSGSFVVDSYRAVLPRSLFQLDPTWQTKKCVKFMRKRLGARSPYNPLENIYSRDSNLLRKKQKSKVDNATAWFWADRFEVESGMRFFFSETNSPCELNLKYAYFGTSLDKFIIHNRGLLVAIVNPPCNPKVHVPPSSSVFIPCRFAELPLLSSCPNIYPATRCRKG